MNLLFSEEETLKCPTTYYSNKY